MKSVLIFTVLFSLATQQVNARDNTARPNAAEFKNLKTTRGLCTSDNKGQEYFDEGYCKSLAEALSGKSSGNKDFSCFKNLAEELRQRQIDQSGKKKALRLNIECDEGEGKRGTTADIAKDPNRWNAYLMQIISNFVIQESEWDVKRDKNNSKKGLLRISKESMDDSKYKCGCNFDPIKSDPMDGHQNIICGAYQALFWAAKDEELYSGFDQRPKKAQGQNYQSPQDNPKDERDSRRGFARVFESAQYNPDDKASVARHEKMEKKMKHYCENYAHGRNGGFDADMTKDYDAGSLGSGKGIRN